MHNDLTAQEVRDILDYDRTTGVFTWRVKPGPRSGVNPGDVAGSIDEDGHRRIRIRRRGYFAHRLAWLYVHGEWPDGPLDHRNRRPDDNRLSNLRPASLSDNCHNRSGAQRNNRSGFWGVSRDVRGRWRAKIKVNGKGRHLGYFPTPEAAAEAYLQAKRFLHPAWTEEV